jgi:hypothetical protein
VFDNAGLCGDLVSVGSLGTYYSEGNGEGSEGAPLRGTALGTACPSPPPPSINTMSPPPSVNTMASDKNGVVTHTGTVGLLVGALAATLFALPLLI